MFRTDMTVKEVASPPGLYCRSGHRAAEMFRRAGTQAPEEPIKFFQVSCNAQVDGVYCEPCLIIANAMAKSERR
jgi:hypothetical protein